jgi:hypothetical protein
MAYDENLAKRIRGGFKKMKVRFEEKRMMGGLCFMVAGKMCVGVEKDRLMARIDPEIYDEALCKKGCVAMDFTGRPMRGFVFVNRPGLTTEGDLNAWLKLAVTFNPKAKAAKKKPAQKPTARSQPRSGK